MKLDRNIDGNEGRGKYALLKLRELATRTVGEPFTQLDPELKAAIDLLTEEGILDLGTVGSPSEFFVIRLRDKYAEAALSAYATAASEDDPEYAAEIIKLADRAGPLSPFCKVPD